MIRVVAGEIFDVAVDLRKGSGTFARWYGGRLSAENRKQVYLPEGFAHGFLVLSDTAIICYKATDFYHPNDEGGLIWNDPDLGITWPLDSMNTLTLSEKDQANASLRSLL